MKISWAICLLFASMLCLATHIRGKEWRSIVPLHSTRADVERVLGSGTNWCKCAYYLDDMNVFINYSSGDCKSGGSGGWDVPADTVLKITVVPKPSPRLSDLKIDENRFEKQTGHIEGNILYVDEEEGFSIEVSGGMVRAFVYGPDAKDKHLRCR